MFCKQHKNCVDQIPEFTVANFPCAIEIFFKHCNIFLTLLALIIIIIIIIINKKEKTFTLIDVAIPADRNVAQRERKRS